MKRTDRHIVPLSMQSTTFSRSRGGIWFPLISDWVVTMVTPLADTCRVSTTHWWVTTRKSNARQLSARTSAENCKTKHNFPTPRDSLGKLPRKYLSHALKKNKTPVIIQKVFINQLSVIMMKACNISKFACLHNKFT